MATGTNNTAGSTAVEDLLANTINFDNLSVGTDPSYPDRLGNLRQSLAGFEAETDQVIDEAKTRLYALNYRGDWATATAYAVNDVYKAVGGTYDGSLIQVLVAHTSSGANPDADYAALKVVLFQVKNAPLVTYSIAELKSLVPENAGQVVFLSAENRKNKATWSTENLSARVAADPNGYQYVAPSGQNGSSGAWVFDDVKTVDQVGGGYLRLLSKMRGGEEFHLSQAISKSAYADLLAGGDDTDYHPIISTVLEDSTNLKLFPTLFYVGDEIQLEGPRVLSGHFGKTQVRAKAIDPNAPRGGFKGASVISSAGTRQLIQDIIVDVPDDVYTPETDIEADRVTAVYTGGLFFHAHLHRLVTFGGWRGYRLGALEAHLTGCHSIGARHSLWVESADAFVSNFSSTDAIETGVFSDAGIEGNNIHIVRAGGVALSLLNQSPVMLNQLFIDTPRKSGIRLAQTNGAMLSNIYFSKLGQGSVPTDPMYYFELTNSRNNRFSGGNIFAGNLEDNSGPIPQNDKAFLRFADTAGDDTKASINNTFEGFQLPSGLAIAENNGQREFALRQKFINCGGEARRWNNEGKLYRSAGEQISNSSSKSYKIFLRNRLSGNAFSAAYLSGEYVFRRTGADRQFGKIVITMPTSDGGTGIGTFVPTVSANGGIPAGMTIGSVTYNRATDVLNFTINNATGSPILTSFTLDNLVDDKGCY